MSGGTITQWPSATISVLFGSSGAAAFTGASAVGTKNSSATKSMNANVTINAKPLMKLSERFQASTLSGGDGSLVCTNAHIAGVFKVIYLYKYSKKISNKKP